MYVVIPSIPFIPVGFTRHHDTFEESLLQHQLSHATSFGDLSYVKGEEKTKYEEMRTASLNLIAELRVCTVSGLWLDMMLITWEMWWM